MHRVPISVFGERCVFCCRSTGVLRIPEPLSMIEVVLRLSARDKSNTRVRKRSMSEFFRDSKRKLGVVTFSLACVVLAMCARGTKIWDKITFASRTRGQFQTLESTHDGLFWARFEDPTVNATEFSWEQFPTSSMAAATPMEIESLQHEIVWSWDVIELEFARWRGLNLNPSVTFWKISYRTSIVLLVVATSWLWIGRRKDINVVRNQLP